MSIIPAGALFQIRNASDEVLGYGWSDPSNAMEYWSLPPVEDRPPDAGVNFYFSQAAPNVTYQGFIDTVRQNWSSNSRFVACTCTEYTSYDDIPQEYRASFFPNAGSGGAAPLEVDIGTIGVYSVSEGVTINEGVVYRSTAGTTYNEYWVLGSGFDNTQTFSLTAGAINRGFNAWSDGMTCILVQSEETTTEPSGG